ncbi:hypothetical protein D3C78_1881650 [compost metagenome]
MLARINGEEHHDWFLELSRALGKDYSVIVEVLYDLWESQGDNEQKINAFLEDLTRLC